MTHSLEGVITIFFNPTMQHVLLVPNALITFRFVIDSQRISREIYVSYFVLPRWQEIKQLLESNGMWKKEDLLAFTTLHTRFNTFK